MKKFFALIATGLALTIATISAAHAGDTPAEFNFDGVLMDTTVTPNVPVAGPVNLTFQIFDPAGTCLLYEESHSSVALVNGAFSKKVGTGTRASASVDGGLALKTVFVNNGSLRIAGSPGCTPGYVGIAGHTRRLRVTVGSTVLSDYALSSVPFAMVAGSVQGYEPADFLQPQDNGTFHLSQTNLVNLFSTTNYAKLNAMLSGTSTDYVAANPAAPLNLNGQRLTNVALPAAGTDAASKSYSDANVGGKGADVSGVGLGVGNGQTLLWDQAQNKWVTGTPSAVDSSKLPLVGGTLTGILSMSPNNYLQVSNRSVDPSGLSAGNAGALWYDSTTSQLRFWNGSAAQPVSSGGGGITSLNGDVNASGTGAVTATIATSAITNAKIAINAVTSNKINSSGIATNRLLMTDATTGSSIGYATCANGEIMQYNVATGWNCTALPVAPVTSVSGKTGTVTLTAADIVGLGTASSKDYGTAPSNVPVLDGTGRLLPSTLPTPVLMNGGNTFSAPVVLGTTDTYPLQFVVSSVNRMTITPVGKVGIGTIAPAVTLDLSATTDAIRIPKGTTAQQAGAGSNGDMRFNTDTQKFEVYENGWVNIIPAVAHGMQLITSSTTFTVPAGVTSVKVIAMGGAGGGCSAGGLCSTTNSGGQGGAGYAFVNGVFPGQTITVTIGTGGTLATTGGAGGATTFGSFVTASGGTGATSATSGTPGNLTTTGFPYISLPTFAALYGGGVGGLNIAGQAGRLIVEW